MSMCDWCKNKQNCHQPEWAIIAVENNDLYCEAFKGDNLPPISFSYVSPAFCAMQKSVTRRNWANVTIKMFRKDSHFLAWSKQARFGGEPIGIGKMVADPFKQDISDINFEGTDGIWRLYEAEGFKYLDGDKTTLLDATVGWINSGGIYTVVPFEIIEVFPTCKERYTTDEEIVRCVKALVKVLP